MSFLSYLPKEFVLDLIARAMPLRLLLAPLAVLSLSVTVRMGTTFSVQRDHLGGCGAIRFENAQGATYFDGVPRGLWLWGAPIGRPRPKRSPNEHVWDLTVEQLHSATFASTRLSLIVSIY